MRRRNPILAMATATAVIATVIPGTAGAVAAVPQQIEVTGGNPYYLMLQAGQQPPVAYGSRARNCVLRAHTSCRGARLGGRKLTQAVLPFSNLDRLDLGRGSLALGNVSFSHMTRSDLQGANLIGSSFNYTNLRRADLRGATLTFA